MPHELKYCGRSDIGLKRTNNEDTYGIDETSIKERDTASDIE
jgi:serine/threonine protein phosphatase PrpC